MQEPALSRRQHEAAEALRLCEQNLALFDARTRRVRITLLELLLIARKRYNEACSRDDAA
jgi:hypothetical protein